MKYFPKNVFDVLISDKYIIVIRYAENVWSSSAEPVKLVEHSIPTIRHAFDKRLILNSLILYETFGIFIKKNTNFINTRDFTVRNTKKKTINGGDAFLLFF